MSIVKEWKGNNKVDLHFATGKCFSLFTSEPNVESNKKKNKKNSVIGTLIFYI